uniref:Uncharacterized protein n=1 Tax=Arundo donax TaxID=35708 RepID=A0A0A8YGK7_ARUDO
MSGRRLVLIDDRKRGIR